MPSKVESKAAQGRGKNIRVIICDDHVAIRTGLRGILEEAQFDVVETCDSLPALVSAALEHHDAIVITDLGIGGLTFPDIVKEIHQHSRECHIIAYSMRESPATIVTCYESGALAFVPKGAAIEELIKAVRFASEGKKYFPAKVAEELANLHVDKNNPKNILSARELQILLYFVECGTVEATVAKFKIAQTTAQNVLSRVSRKLNTPRSMLHRLVSKYQLDDSSL